MITPAPKLSQWERKLLKRSQSFTVTEEIQELLLKMSVYENLYSSEYSKKLMNEEESKDYYSTLKRLKSLRIVEDEFFWMGTPEALIAQKWYESKKLD